MHSSCLNNHMFPMYIYIYIYQTCHRQRYTHYFIDMREATRFLSENNVSGDIDQIHHHSMRPLLSLFRRYFLASPGTNAVCTTTLVTRDIDTRVGGGSTTGRRVNVPRCVAREGGRGWNRWSTLSCANIFFPLFFSFFLLFSLSFFPTIRTPLLHPRLPFVLRLLSLVSALQFLFFFLFPFLFLLFLVYSKPKGKEEWKITLAI